MDTTDHSADDGYGRAAAAAFDTVLAGPLAGMRAEQLDEFAVLAHTVAGTPGVTFDVTDDELEQLHGFGIIAEHGVNTEEDKR